MPSLGALAIHQKARLIIGPSGYLTSVADFLNARSQCAHGLAANAALRSKRTLCPSRDRPCHGAQRLRDVTWQRFRSAQLPCSSLAILRLPVF
jgi:hypothetical protein